MTKIIAELCQNHKGDRKILGKMIEEAAKNGADYIKIQSIFAADLTKRERFEEGKISGDGTVKVIKRPHGPEFTRLSKLDLTIGDHLWFIGKCKKLGVVPMTTVFARGRIGQIGELPWPEKVVKVASYDCASYPMLNELIKYFDHLIVSTGATHDEEIEKTARLVKEAGKKLTFLHCVTSYPNTLEVCNLKRMNWLRGFTDEVGWSDHTLVERDGTIASQAAIALGAGFIERHFTVLARDETKDGPVSITPILLKELDRYRRLPNSEQKNVLKNKRPDWQIMLGSATREMTHAELLNRDYYRGRFASLVDGKRIYNWEEGKAI